MILWASSHAARLRAGFRAWEAPEQGWPALALPFVLGGFAFALYLRTLARTITWEHLGADGPELAAAAYVLGIGHPPGYPLYLMLAHLFIQLPIGEVAFRVGLLSATAAAVGVGLAAYLAWTLSPVAGPARILGAGATGVVLATAPMYWSQATIVGVRPLNAAFVLGALTLAAHWRPSADRTVVALALLLGLGLGHHLTLALMGLPLTGMILVRDPHLVRRRGALVAIGAFGLGLLVYAYLPLRAWAQTPMNWGNPGDLPSFIAHVSATIYHGDVARLPFEDMLGRLPAAARMLAEQLTWPGLVLAFAGLGQLWARQRPLAMACFVGAALTLVFTILYAAGRTEVYLLTVVLVLATGLGLGVADLAAGWSVPLAASAMAAIVGWQIWTQYPTMDVSGDETAAIYARTTLANAEPDALIWTYDDETTFALWYAQVVEGRRPDVAVVARGLVGAPWYMEALERTHPGTMARISP